MGTKEVTPKQKYLIINADDFGLNSSVNQAVLAAHLNDTLTSTSLMPTAPPESFKKAVEILKENPRLDCGIHLTLFQKNFNRKIKGEIRKQIEKVLETGVTPSHLNSHYYVTELPYLSTMLIELAREYHIKAIRNPDETKSFVDLKTFSPLKYATVQVVKSLAKHNRAKILRHKLLTSNYYYGHYHSGNLDTHKILGVLKHLRPGLTELLVHPALKNSAHFHERDEYEALMSERVRRYIEDNGIKLTCYREV